MIGRPFVSYRARLFGFVKLVALLKPTHVTYNFADDNQNRARLPKRSRRRITSTPTRTRDRARVREKPVRSVCAAVPR
jgi:hypothetical protein